MPPKRYRQLRDAVLAALHEANPRTLAEITTATDLPLSIVRGVLTGLKANGQAVRQLRSTGLGGRLPDQWLKSSAHVPTAELARACETVLAVIDECGTARRAQIIAAREHSAPITEAAIHLLLERGEIVDGTAGYTRPDGLDLTSNFGRTVDAIRKLSRPVSRLEIFARFPEMQQTHLDAIVHRAIASGHLTREGGLVVAAQRSASRHVTEDDVLAVFTGDAALSPKLIREKLPNLNTRRLPWVLERLLSTGHLIRVGRASYAKPGTKAGSLPLVGRVRDLLAANPGTVFSAHDISSILSIGDVQSMRMTLSRLHCDGHAERVAPRLYRHGQAEERRIASDAGARQQAIKETIERHGAPMSLGQLCRELGSPRHSVQSAAAECVRRGELLSFPAGRYGVPDGDALTSPPPEEAVSRILRQLGKTKGLQLLSELAKGSGLAPDVFAAALDLAISQQRLVTVLLWAVRTSPPVDFLTSSTPSTMRVFGALLRYGSLENVPRKVLRRSNSVEHAIRTLVNGGVVIRDGDTYRVAPLAFLDPLRPKAQTAVTTLEKLVLDHVAKHPNRRKVEIANAITRGRGVVNRAVTSLVAKGYLRSRNERYRVGLGSLQDCGATVVDTPTTPSATAR